MHDGDVVAGLQFLAVLVPFHRVLVRVLHLTVDDRGLLLDELHGVERGDETDVRCGRRETKT